MKRIAIIGGGIAGLAAAYELEKRRKAGADIDWTIYEASARLGGIIETTRYDDFILEGGPDAWVSEKPWARELAIELGLEAELISSNDATRKTYILIDGMLQPMPDRMRMMVPEDLTTLENSPLFSHSAREAYAAEITHADELKATAPPQGESVASFVRRHFGEEVLTKIGAPLLSGVFGGDVAKLSVQSVMPAFVAMEREHGSLILAVQARAKSHGGKAPQAIFTSLRNGMASLVDALVKRLPPERIRLLQPAISLKREGKLWCLRTAKGSAGKSKKHFHQVLLATPLDTTRRLLETLAPEAAALLPYEASSAVLAAFCWPVESAAEFTVPPGFGFLVPQAPRANEEAPQILACTFVDQKFPHRAPTGARVIRVFFGSGSAEAFAAKSDAEIAALAFSQLQSILGPMPDPEAAFTAVRRWPRSLPQYEVGHGERMQQLEAQMKSLPGVTLLGNSYRGVGLPDLIRDARTAAAALCG